MDYAKAKSIEYNQEHLALACLFHDLGLTEEFHNPKQAFIYNSSATLRDFLQAKQYAAQDTVTLMETIDFHFSLRPHWQSGPVAGLLQIGTWMDVTGRKSRQIPGARQKARATFDSRGFFLYFNRCLCCELLSWQRLKGILAPAHHCPENHYPAT